MTGPVCRAPVPSGVAEEGAGGGFLTGPAAAISARPAPLTLLTRPRARGRAAEERSASVTLVYECDGVETKFMRAIRKDGVGEKAGEFGSAVVNKVKEI